MHNTFDSESEFNAYFKQLYQAYSGKIYNYILGVSGGNTYLAEEIVQIAFIKIWERRQTLKDRHLVVAYLYTIVRNTFYNMCARDAVRYVYQNYILKGDKNYDDTTEQTLDTKLLEEFIGEMIEKLPKKRQEVFLKSRMENKSYKDIAEEMQISENTVENHISLALKYLREQLKSHFDTVNSWFFGLFTLVSSLIN
jgi:RNA polymerase sigma-70 factor (family 1)